MEWSDDEEALIRRELAQILASGDFAAKITRAPILKYIVEENLNGHTPTESEIYNSVIKTRFTRWPADEQSSNVRTQVSDLRDDLYKHYALLDDDKRSPCRIFISERGYGIIVKFDRARSANGDALPPPSHPGESSTRSAPMNTEEHGVLEINAPYEQLGRIMHMALPIITTAANSTMQLICGRQSSILIEFRCNKDAYRHLHKAFTARRLTHIAEFPITSITRADRFYKRMLRTSGGARFALFTIPMKVRPNERYFNLTIHTLAGTIRHSISIDRSEAFASQKIPIAHRGLLDVRTFQSHDGLHWPGINEDPEPFQFFRVEFTVITPPVLSLDISVDYQVISLFPKSLLSKLIGFFNRLRHPVDKSSKHQGLFLRQLLAGNNDHPIEFGLEYGDRIPPFQSSSRTDIPTRQSSSDKQSERKRYLH